MLLITTFIHCVYTPEACRHQNVSPKPENSRNLVSFLYEVTTSINYHLLTQNYSAKNIVNNSISMNGNLNPF